MSSELYEALTERFVKGIRKSFTPCPLIGPKWLQEFPKGRPADFRFFGMRKLAKATGRPVGKIIPIVMRNISFDGLGVEWELKQGCLIDINLKGKERPAPKPSKPAQAQPPHSPKTSTPSQQAEKRKAFRQARKQRVATHQPVSSVTTDQDSE